MGSEGKSEVWHVIKKYLEVQCRVKSAMFSWSRV